MKGVRTSSGFLHGTAQDVRLHRVPDGQIVQDGSGLAAKAVGQQSSPFLGDDGLDRGGKTRDATAFGRRTTASQGFQGREGLGAEYGHAGQEIGEAVPHVLEFAGDAPGRVEPVGLVDDDQKAALLPGGQLPLDEPPVGGLHPGDGVEDQDDNVGLGEIFQGNPCPGLRQVLQARRIDEGGPFLEMAGCGADADELDRRVALGPLKLCL